MRTRPRLRTILIWVNLIVLLMPVSALFGLRLYETELIRRTEAEVISQAALIKASFERLLQEELDAAADARAPIWEDDGREPVAAQWPVIIEERFRPVAVTLDLRREKIVAYPGPPEPAAGPVNPVALRAGQRLEPILVDAQQMTMSGMRVVDRNANVLASSQTDERGFSVAHHPDVQRALSGEFTKIWRARKAFSGPTSLGGLSRASRMQVVVSIPVVYQGRVVGAVSAWRTPVDLPKALYENRGMLALLLAVFLLGVGGISLMTSYYIGRPIRRLMAQVEAGAKEGAGPTGAIQNPGTREVQQLSDSVAQMAQTLQQRAEYIRTFATHVSHEFKTPLTAIRATVELLEDHLDTMSAEKRQEFLASVDADARRLQYLVTRLMDLARADVIAPGDATCDVLRALDEAVEQGSTLGIDVLIQGASGADLGDDEAGVEARNTPPGTVLRAAVGEEVLSSVLSNLLTNAAQHGAHEVQISVQVEPEQIILTFEDDGPGISPANAARVFDEFFTTRRDAGGSGLGLAIVRTMLRRFGADIELVSQAPQGAAFRICAPRRIKD